MAVIETWFNQVRTQPVKVRYIDGNVFSQDNNGNLIGVNVLEEDGTASTLSGSVSASVIRADGATVAVTGTRSGNRASVTLPQACYAVPGVLSVVIKLTSGTTVTTLCAVVANIYQSSTDTVVDPGTIIPSIDALIAEIEAAIASVPADYSALWESLAPVFSTTMAYTVGQWATYNGGLYQFVNPHSGSWDAADVAELPLSDGVFKNSSWLEVLPIESGNIMLLIDLSSGTHNGIKFDYISNGLYHIHGTSTANAFCAFYNDSSNLPAGMVAGKWYFVRHTNSNIRFAITTYDSSGNPCTQFITSSRFVYIPANAVGARIRWDITSGKTVDTFAYTNIVGNDIIDHIIQAEDKLYDSRIVLNGGYYIATNGATADISATVANESYMFAVLDCVGNDLFTINGKGAGTARLYAFIDADGNVLQKAESQEEATEKLIIAPAGSAKLIINSQGTNQTGYGCFVGVSNNQMLEFQKRSLYFDEKDGMSGENHLNGAYWARGYSDYETGIVNPSFDYRVSHYNYVEYPMNIRLHIDPNYTYNAHNTDGELITSSTRKDTVIPANTKFRVNIRRYPEGDNHTPANIDEFANALQFFVDEAGSIDKYAPTNLDTHTHTIAHRGVPNSAPGNTKPSYVLARQMGLIIAEGDVRFTSNDVAVLAHEDTYTVDGVTHTISSETYEQFMQWDQGAGSEIYEGTYGLSLSAFLDLCNNLGLTPTIEFKVGTTAQIESCLDIIDAKRVKVFNYKASVANLKTIIDHDPYASVRVGGDNYTTAIYNAIVELVGYGQQKHKVHCIYSRYGEWTDEQINACRTAGAIIGVTSVNSNTALKALTQDVDIIFTEAGFNATMYKTINEME